MVDLHVHSNYSDGSFSPRELVEYAITHNITAFALTDHDTTCGLTVAIRYAKELSGKVSDKNPEGKSVEVIPGIEFSTEYECRDIHVVGLFIHYDSAVFQNQITAFIDSRDTRNEKMCALLREHGISISYEELKNLFPSAVITRAHYARFLCDKGYVNSMSEAFDRYVGDYASCFVPREKVTPVQAVKLILSAGGIPVLAHPILYHMSTTKLKGLVSELREAGLMAIEGIYSTYSSSETRQVQEIAKEYHLLISGGSDFHGNNKPELHFGTGYGKLYIHESVLETLKGALTNPQQ
ncbi:MAG TPA: PHP domain-containing protein [Lachnospiraceae bacterium]|nr:PHP domain-containing protein [Lachnospiraceae bacterium]